jgi:peptidyl-tRNA hydrolase, PTH1 family
MKLIVGLGNPGDKYEKSRHNLGFAAVESFFKDTQTPKHSVWSKKARLQSEISSIEFAGQNLILAKPTTYMNNSGVAVGLLSSYYKIKSENVWVIYDELDLPVGKLKIRFGGAAAGHHGVESIMASLGTDKFWRFRLGIGHSHDKEKVIGRQKIRKAKEYVLDAFGTEDRGKVRELIKHASSALQMALDKDVESAMNKYNTR